MNENTVTVKQAYWQDMEFSHILTYEGRRVVGMGGARWYEGRCELTFEDGDWTHAGGDETMVIVPARAEVEP